MSNNFDAGRGGWKRRFLHVLPGCCFWSMWSFFACMYIRACVHECMHAFEHEFWAETYFLFYFARAYMLESIHENIHRSLVVLEDAAEACMLPYLPEQFMDVCTYACTKACFIMNAHMYSLLRKNLCIQVHIILTYAYENVLKKYVHACQVSAPVRICICVSMYIHKNIYIYIYTYIYTCIHTCTYEYADTYM